MARRANAIKQEREENEGIVLLLDAGGSLVGQWVSVRSQGRNLVEAMSAMGYDAIAVGHAELTIGLEALKERQAEASFAFLSANLVSSEEMKPIFDPYMLLERKGTRIGIIGLSELEAAQAVDVGEQATVLEPISSASGYVDELRDKVDILIVLSHLGLDKDKELAQALPGIDIIVGGYSRILMQEPERVGNTLIVQQGYKGEWMGRLRATFDAQGVPVAYEEEVITLGPEFEDDPEMAALVEKWDSLYPTLTPWPTATPQS